MADLKQIREKIKKIIEKIRKMKKSKKTAGLISGDYEEILDLILDLYEVLIEDASLEELERILQALVEILNQLEEKGKK